jgi:hypothetical protein
MIELTAPIGVNSQSKLAPAGTHVAICYQIIDLGTCEQGGQFPGKKRKIQFLFELPNEKTVFSEDKGEQPFYCRNVYTLSMHEKSTLRKDVQGWLGKNLTDSEAKTFNIFKLLGQPCMISLVHVDKGGSTYANINSISKLPKGLTVPECYNPQLAFSPIQPDMNAFNKLPTFIQDKIRQSDEWILNNATGVPLPNIKSEVDPGTSFFTDTNDLPWD